MRGTVNPLYKRVGSNPTPLTIFLGLFEFRELTRIPLEKTLYARLQSTILFSESIPL